MKHHFKASWIVAAGFLAAVLLSGHVSGRTLDQIRAKGVLRHLGVPYANFVTGSGDGMDVELVRLFAWHIGVEYRYVKSSWPEVIGHMTGTKVRAQEEEIEILEQVPVKGDLIANGFTILPWRKKIVAYSTPVFPTQVWVLAGSANRIDPIRPSSSIDRDISMVKALLKEQTILGVANTCLDPDLYHIEQTGARVKLFTSNLNQLAPALIKGEADLTLLDVPDALIALNKWPGRLKVIGPVSRPQEMGVAFPKTAHELRAEFNRFFDVCRKNGTFLRLVKKYYPGVFDYYPDFFQKKP